MKWFMNKEPQSVTGKALPLEQPGHAASQYLHKRGEHLDYAGHGA